jgi:hypothetical protein
VPFDQATVKISAVEQQLALASRPAPAAPSSFGHWAQAWRRWVRDAWARIAAALGRRGVDRSRDGD